MNQHEFNERLTDLAKEMRAAEDDAFHAVDDAAKAERSYRRRQALALVAIKDYRNADDRTAQMELLEFEDGNTVGDFRCVRDLKRDGRDIQKEVVRNRRQELSALQTLGRLSTEEAMFDRTGPSEVP